MPCIWRRLQIKNNLENCTRPSLTQPSLCLFVLGREEIFTTLLSRFVLVKYADRGLVQNGSPNLTLFIHLHWLVFFIFTAMCYIGFPLTKQIKGDFPENTIKGQICMKMEFTLDQTNLRQRIMNLIFPLIMISTNMRFRISLSNFIKGRNLNMRSCAQFGGKNQRNIMTMDETLKYFLQSMAL